MKRNPKKPPTAGLPPGYGALLNDIKARISTARTRAAMAVSRELVDLYWHVGRAIVQRQHSQGWGKSVVVRLSADIQKEFPGLRGFSPQNIWKMRAFYLGWTEDIEKLSQPVRELDGKTLPDAIGRIPWRHNIELIFKLKDPKKRLWYAQKALEHGWSLRVLVHQIESDLHSRQGRALTNFEATLPAPQSDMARELIKDPYNFEFLGPAPGLSERRLEESLTDQLKDFLVELGEGFAFVGRQYHLEVGGDDFYLDLLFYHLSLRCFIVIDLKVEPFKPEFAGKMSFYLSAADDLLRHPDDNPSIGLILCQHRNRIIVEYTLRDTTKPLGIATYKILPKNLKPLLPSTTQIASAIK